MILRWDIWDFWDRFSMRTKNIRDASNDSKKYLKRCASGITCIRDANDHLYLRYLRFLRQVLNENQKYQRRVQWQSRISETFGFRDNLYQRHEWSFLCEISEISETGVQWDDSYEMTTMTTKLHHRYCSYLKLYAIKVWFKDLRSWSMGTTTVKWLILDIYQVSAIQFFHLLRTMRTDNVTDFYFLVHFLFFIRDEKFFWYLT